MVCGGVRLVGEWGRGFSGCGPGLDGRGGSKYWFVAHFETAVSRKEGRVENTAKTYNF